MVSFLILTTLTINAEINNEINEVNKRPKYELNTNNKQKKD